MYIIRLFSMCLDFLCFFFQQNTAYQVRISYWSSDVCSSDLLGPGSAERSSAGLRCRCGTAKLSRFPARGAIAQLGERLHGMQEVGGSIPPGSTNSPKIGRAHV